VNFAAPRPREISEALINGRLCFIDFDYFRECGFLPSGAKKKAQNTCCKLT